MRKFACLLTAALMLVILAACSGSGGDTPPADDPDDRPELTDNRDQNLLFRDDDQRNDDRDDRDTDDDRRPATTRPGRGIGIAGSAGPSCDGLSPINLTLPSTQPIRCSTAAQCRFEVTVTGGNGEFQWDIDEGGLRWVRQNINNATVRFSGRPNSPEGGTITLSARARGCPGAAPSLTATIRIDVVETLSLEVTRMSGGDGISWDRVYRARVVGGLGNEFNWNLPRLRPPPTGRTGRRGMMFVDTSLQGVLPASETRSRVNYGPRDENICIRTTPPSTQDLANTPRSCNNEFTGRNGPRDIYIYLKRNLEDGSVLGIPFDVRTAQSDIASHLIPFQYPPRVPRVVSKKIKDIVLTMWFRHRGSGGRPGMTLVLCKTPSFTSAGCINTDLGGFGILEHDHRQPHSSTIAGEIDLTASESSDLYFALKANADELWQLIQGIRLEYNVYSVMNDGSLQNPQRKVYWNPAVLKWLHYRDEILRFSFNDTAAVAIAETREAGPPKSGDTTLQFRNMGAFHTSVLWQGEERELKHPRFNESGLFLDWGCIYAVPGDTVTYGDTSFNSDPLTTSGSSLEARISKTDARWPWGMEALTVLVFKPGRSFLYAGGQIILNGNFYSTGRQGVPPTTPPISLESEYYPLQSVFDWPQIPATDSNDFVNLGGRFANNRCLDDLELD